MAVARSGRTAPPLQTNGKTPSRLTFSYKFNYNSSTRVPFLSFLSFFLSFFFFLYKYLFFQSIFIVISEKKKKNQWPQGATDT